MEKILLDVQDKDRLFSEDEMQIIYCAYLMNDIKMLLGADWLVDWPSFTPNMMFFKFRVEQNVTQIAQNPYYHHFVKYLKISLTTLKCQVLNRYEKLEASIGKKTSGELADYLEEEFRKEVTKNDNP